MELLIVLVIFSIIAIITVPFLGSSVGRNELQTTTWQLADTIRQARSRAMGGDQNSVWGVHVTSTQFVLFRGTTYNVSDPDNLATTISSYLSITPISLNGGSADVRFDKIKGTSSDYGTITVRDNNSNTTKTITITATGTVTNN